MCYGCGVYGAPTQHRFYSAGYTFVSVSLVENKIHMKHAGIRMKYWSLLVAFYEIRMSFCPFATYKKQGLQGSYFNLRTKQGGP